MAGPSGADGQIGFKTEAVVGTPETVDQFVPFVSESIKNDLAYMDTKTISARKVLRITKRGAAGVAGSVSTELANVTAATLLKHAFGTVQTTGAGPYTHTYTPGDLTGQSLTVQVGRPATSGTIHPFTYAGCKVTDWALKCSVGELATFDLSILGMSETTGEALATASYDSTWSPFTFVEGSVTVGGSAVASVKSVDLSGKNAVAGRVRVGSADQLEALEAGLRDYSGTIVTDFDALTHYALYTAGTETAIVLAFVNGADTLTFTLNAQFTGETPNVGGFDLLEQALPFRCVSSVDDATAITAVLVNTETTAA